MQRIRMHGRDDGSRCVVYCTAHDVHSIVCAHETKRKKEREKMEKEKERQSTHEATRLCLVVSLCQVAC